MGRALTPKCKQCRRLGEKLMLKGERCNSPKCAMVKRNYPPGFHGPKGRGRQSGYGLQLAEKQKAKKTYGVLEKQFKLTFDKAKNQPGDSGVNLMQLLEMRLDNVVYRLGFTPSRVKARQLVSHGHFIINGKKVDVPSYLVKTADVIELKKRNKQVREFKNVEERIKKSEIPGWLNFDIKEMKGKCLHKPGINDIKSNISTQMIVEYYSR